MMAVGAAALGGPYGETLCFRNLTPRQIPVSRRLTYPLTARREISQSRMRPPSSA